MRRKVSPNAVSSAANTKPNTLSDSSANYFPYAMDEAAYKHATPNVGANRVAFLGPDTISV